MAGFIRVSGKPNIEYWKKTASVAIANGALTYLISGGVNAADATSGDHLGICMKTIASTDADYAVATSIPIDVAGENDIFQVGVAASTVATLTALVGTYIDLTSSVVADATASSKDALLVVGVVDASTVLVKIASRINILRTATT
jgi:ABC-type branched-subunit amino acid transport system substrate-binding protein